MSASNCKPNTRENELCGESAEEKVSDAQNRVLRLQCLLDTICALADDEENVSNVIAIARLGEEEAGRIQVGLDYLSMDLRTAAQATTT